MCERGSSPPFSTAFFEVPSLSFELLVDALAPEPGKLCVGVVGRGLWILDVGGEGEDCVRRPCGEFSKSKYEARCVPRDWILALRDTEADLSSALGVVGNIPANDRKMLFALKALDALETLLCTLRRDLGGGMSLGFSISS